MKEKMLRTTSSLSRSKGRRLAPRVSILDIIDAKLQEFSGSSIDGRKKCWSTRTDRLFHKETCGKAQEKAEMKLQRINMKVEMKNN
jgi:hypothetical protein